MYARKRTGPRTEPCGTLEETGMQFEFTPFMTLSSQLALALRSANSFAKQILLILAFDYVSSSLFELIKMVQRGTDSE